MLELCGLCNVGRGYAHTNIQLFGIHNVNEHVPMLKK